MSFAEKIERSHPLGKAVSEVEVDGNVIGLNPTDISIPREGRPTTHLIIRDSRGRRGLKGEILVITVVDPRGFTDEDHARLAVETSSNAWARLEGMTSRRKPLTD